MADVERAIEGNDGGNLVISKEQLRDLLELVKGHSASKSEYPSLAGHQGMAAETSFKHVAQRAAASAAIPTHVTESDEIFATQVTVVVDLFDTLLFESKNGPFIPQRHAAPLKQLLTAIALVEVCSYVGFQTFGDYHREGGTIQIGRRTVKQCDL